MKKIFKYYEKFYKKPKLNIGCGNKCLPKFLNTDLIGLNTSNIDNSIIRHIYNCDKVFFMDATKTFDIDSECITSIYSEHMFEHLTYVDGKKMLLECYRVLKKAGHIRLCIPSFEFIEKLIKNKNTELVSDYCKFHASLFDKHLIDDFENIPIDLVVNNFMHMWGHLTIYSQDTIKTLFKNIGFKNVQFQQVNQSLYAEFLNIELHNKEIPFKFFVFESLCIEAEK